MALVVKIMAGAALCFYYQRTMSEDRDKADVFKYYDESKHISSKSSEPSLYLSMFFSSDCRECKIQYEKMRHWYKPKKFGFVNDSRTMIKLHAFLSLISGGYYAPQIVFFAFLSFIGLIFMMKGLQLLQARAHLESLLVLLMFPSILLWTSAPLKECLFSVILGVTFYHFVLSTRGNRGSYIYLLLIILSTYFLKPQIGILLAGSILFCGVLPSLLPSRIKKWQYFGFITTMALIGALCLPGIFKNLNQKKQQYDLEARGQAHVETKNAIFLVSLDRIRGASLHENVEVNAAKQIYWLKTDKENWIEQSTDSIIQGKVVWTNKVAKTHVQMEDYSDFLSWLKLTPTAIKNIFLEPLPNTFFGALFFIENILLIGLIIFGFKNGSEWGAAKYLLVFSIILTMLYGTTVPVIGALLRYKSLIYLALLLYIFAANKRAIIPYFRAYD